VAGVAAVDAAAVATATRLSEPAGAPALVEARPQALLIAAARFALAVGGLVAAIARGVDRGPALGLVAFGAAIVLLSVYGGDRRRRSGLKFEDPDPMPAGAHVQGHGRALAQAAYPSTIGLTALIAIALWPQPSLAALLAGILGGLGVMSLVGATRLASWEHSRQARILVEGKTSRVFEAPR
jgi:hypothetical protein